MKRLFQRWWTAPLPSFLLGVAVILAVIAGIAFVAIPSSAPDTSASVRPNPRLRAAMNSDGMLDLRLSTAHPYVTTMTCVPQGSWLLVGRSDGWHCTIAHAWGIPVQVDQPKTGHEAMWASAVSFVLTQTQGQWAVNASPLDPQIPAQTDGPAMNSLISDVLMKDSVQ